jgi:hypothetical protein
MPPSLYSSFELMLLVVARVEFGRYETNSGTARDGVWKLRVKSSIGTVALIRQRARSQS